MTFPPVLADQWLFYQNHFAKISVPHDLLLDEKQAQSSYLVIIGSASPVNQEKGESYNRSE